MKETLEKAAENHGWRVKTNSFSTPVKANELAESSKEDFIAGAMWQTERSYTEEAMINASRYGYNFHKTTSFPEQEFDDSCIRNTQQWLTTFKKQL